MKPQIQLTNGAHGWLAQSRLQLDDNRALSVSTMKRHDGAVTTAATAGVLNGDFFSYIMFDDFYLTVRSQRYPRATKNVILDQHNSVDYDALVKQANEFYSKKTS